MKKKIHGDRRDPSGGRGTAPIGGDGECPGGNPRARWRPTDMEAGAGWRGGADGRKGIPTHSISVEHADTGGGGWGGRGRASGHGRGGWQARRGGAARGAAGSGNSGGGTGDQGCCVENSAARDAGRQQKHKDGRGPGQMRVKRRVAKVRYDTWHGLGVAGFQYEPELSCEGHICPDTHPVRT